MSGTRRRSQGLKVKWNQNDLTRAFKLVEDGTAIREAARRCGIPFSTLQERLKHKNCDIPSMGRNPVFTKEQEAEMAHQIKFLKESDIDMVDMRDDDEDIDVEENENKCMLCGDYGQNNELWYRYTSYSHVRVYNADYWNIDLPKMFVVEQPATRLAEDVSFQAGNSTRVLASPNGLLKALVWPEGTTTPVHMDYVQYDTQKGKDNNSGAYLFIPTGQAEEFKPSPFPEMVIIEGMYKATLYTALNGPGKADVVLGMSVYNNPSLPQTELEITNVFLIDHQVDDLELAIRLSTGVKNGDVFYTDLNGMQMIKRRYFDKLPLQANFYPLAAAAYIEDESTRLTVLTSTPLGMAALQPGQIEIMQDRRLSKDDNRGMAQGVTDNVRTQHTFKLLLEPANKPCQKPPAEHPSGALSLGAHVSGQLLLQPLVVLQYSARAEDARPAHARPRPPAADLVLASMHSGVHAKSKDGTVEGVGLTFQRVHLDACFGKKDIANWYPLGDGQVQLTDYVDTTIDKMHESSLTYVSLRGAVPAGVLTLCPMEVRSVFIEHNLKQG